MSTDKIIGFARMAGIVKTGMFEKSPIPAAIVGLDGRIRYSNSALNDALGYGNLEGVHFGDITHPDDLQKDQEQFDQLVSEEIPSYTMEKKYLTAGGNEVKAILTAWRATIDGDQYIFGSFKVQ